MVENCFGMRGRPTVGQQLFNPLVVGVEPKGTTPSEVTFDGPQGTFLGGGGMAAGDTITS